MWQIRCMFWMRELPGSVRIVRVELHWMRCLFWRLVSKVHIFSSQFTLPSIDSMDWVVPHSQQKWRSEGLVRDPQSWNKIYEKIWQTDWQTTSARGKLHAPFGWWQVGSFTLFFVPSFILLAWMLRGNHGETSDVPRWFLLRNTGWFRRGYDRLMYSTWDVKTHFFATKVPDISTKYI